jgi:hypothetical protein
VQGQALHAGQLADGGGHTPANMIRKPRWMSKG